MDTEEAVVADKTEDNGWLDEDILTIAGAAAEVDTKLAAGWDTEACVPSSTEVIHPSLRNIILKQMSF